MDAGGINPISGLPNYVLKLDLILKKVGVGGEWTAQA